MRERLEQSYMGLVFQMWFTRQLDSAGLSWDLMERIARHAAVLQRSLEGLNQNGGGAGR
jgi:hypothetical protein